MVLISRNSLCENRAYDLVGMKGLRWRYFLIVGQRDSFLLGAVVVEVVHPER